MHWYIKRENGLFRNIIMSLACSMVGSYILMCLVWAVTGMRFGAVFCLKIFIWTFCCLILAGLGLSIYFYRSRRARIRAIREHSLVYGMDDKYFRMLEDFLGKPEDSAGYMRMAAFYLEGRRFGQCRELLEQVDFNSLSQREEEEYFNICLCCAVREGDRALANEIYFKARRYFDRAVMRSRRHILHTLGELCLMNGRPSEAEALFLDAWSIRDRRMKFECSIGLSRSLMARGDLEQAKDFCIRASGYVTGRYHAEELRRLMKEVEAAYRSAAGQERGGNDA